MKKRIHRKESEKKSLARLADSSRVARQDHLQFEENAVIDLIAEVIVKALMDRDKGYGV